MFCQLSHISWAPCHFHFCYRTRPMQYCIIQSTEIRVVKYVWNEASILAEYLYEKSFCRNSENILIQISGCHRPMYRRTTELVQTGPLLDKRKGTNTKCSQKRNIINLVIGMNIFRKNPSINLRWRSWFQVLLFPKSKELCVRIKCPGCRWWKKAS
jgi:hypothetical protein